MFMTQDWKDKLASMAGGLPAGDHHAEEQNPPEVPTLEGNLRVLLDRKGRKGKTATIIEGFEVSDEEVQAIASELKRKIGTGGSARGGEILLQGDWRSKAAELLRKKGYKVKEI